MAANAGKIFVQVELDDKKFKTSLANMPSDAKATASGIETVWRTLGTQSEAAFNAQRTAYKNALTLIKNDVNSTKADIIRAEEAAAAKIKAIDSQQYGERTSFLSNLKANWLAATAVIAAAAMAFSKPVNAYMEAESALLKLGVALNNQGQYTKDALNELVSFSEQMQKTTTLEDDLAKSIMGTLSSFGMTTEEIKRSTQAAADMASFTGKSIETVADLLGKAYAGNTSALSRYGIVVDETGTKSEKFQAVLEQLEQRFGGAAQAELLTYAGQWKQLQNQWGDIQETLGYGLLKTIEALLTGIGLIGVTFLSAGEAVLNTIDTITTPFQWLLKGFAALAEMAGMDRAADALRTVAGATEEARANISAAKEATLAWTSKQYDLLTASGGVTTALDKMADSGRKAGGQDILSGMTLLGNEVVTVEEAVKRTDAATKAQAESAKKAAKEAADAAKAQGDAYIKMYTDEKKEANAFYEKLVTQRDADAKHAGDVAAANYKTITDADAKLLAAKEADSTAYQKLITGEADFAETENERAINKIIADHGAKMTALNTLQEGGNLTYKQYVDAKALIDKNYNAALINQAETARDKVNDASYSIYKTGTGYGKEAYEFAVAKIAAQAEKYKEMGVSVTAVQKYIKDANNEAYIAMLKDSSDWKDGVVAYFKEAATQAKTSATYMYDVMKTFADSSKTAISTTLFDAIKTGTVDMQTVWNTFADTMLKKLTDTVASMAVEWAQNGIAKMIASADTLWVETSTGLLELASESKTTFGGMATEFGGAILNMISAAGQEISMTFTAVWDAASAAVIAGIKALQKFFAYEGGYVRESGIGAYAGGGQVQGYASGGDSKANDTVLAWLSPGEYVMPRSAVNSQTIPHLEYMREHKEPRGYAYGGIIPHDDQLTGLSAPYQGSLKWYDDDEWEKLTDPYRMLHDHYGLTYYNGKWGKLGFSEDEYGPYPSSFSAVDDPITYTGQIINAENGYQLQDENNPPQPLDTKDYEYLLNWYGSSIGAVPNTGWGDCIYDQWAAEHGMNATTGAVDPNHIWVEEENGGYRWYMRDGSDYWVDPSESNWLKRFMPGIIKGIGAVAAIVIASAAALPTGGQSFTALAGIMAAIEGGMASLPALYAAGAAGLYSAFCTYGETGSLTGALIAGIISAASTAISFGSGTSTNWIDNGSGLMVLQSEMPQAGYLTAAQGRVIADVIRKGGGEVLQQTLSDVLGGGGSMAISKSGTSGGLGDLESQYYGLPGLMSGAVSLRSGLDYVPYDNFPARLHKGERVLTAEDNKSGRGDIILNFNLNGTVIDRKAVNEFAELIYPRLQKLQAWGH